MEGSQHSDTPRVRKPRQTLMREKKPTPRAVARLIARPRLIDQVRMANARYEALKALAGLP